MDIKELLMHATQISYSHLTSDALSSVLKSTASFSFHVQFHNSIHTSTMEKFLNCW
jgi:hypothetical protein